MTIKKIEVSVDEKLQDAFDKNDYTAYILLGYVSFYEQLLSFIRSRGIDSNDALDILQIKFHQLIKKENYDMTNLPNPSHGKWKNERTWSANYKSWLMKGLEYGINNFFNGKKKRPLLCSTEPIVDRHCHDPISEWVEEEHWLALKEEIELFFESQLDKDIFNFVILQGLKQSELARMKGVDPSLVRQRKRRLILRLKKLDFLKDG